MGQMLKWGVEEQVERGHTTMPVIKQLAGASPLF
jgi:hypothetical protein